MFIPLIHANLRERSRGLAKIGGFDYLGRTIHMTLDYGTPFSFLFKDKAWFKKFAIASLLTYTLIGAAPVFGWMIVIVRRVAKNDDPALPEFTDWNTYWRLGGQFAFINVLWLLPLLAAAIVIYLPLMFVKQLETGTLLTVWFGTFLCVMLFLLIYLLIYAFFFPAMQVLLAQTGSRWQPANPIRLWKTVRAHFVPYLLVFLIVGLALLNVTFLLAGLTLFLLLPPLLVYVSLVGAHYAGQLMRMDQEE
jgi:hypothetical protein